MPSEPRSPIPSGQTCNMTCTWFFNVLFKCPFPEFHRLVGLNLLKVF
jgi:hypothetical protein